MNFMLMFTQSVHGILALQVNDVTSADSQNPLVRTIDFVFDPDVDTADNLAAEISEEFSLSPTDTEICAAALREWLAKDMPGGWTARGREERMHRQAGFSSAAWRGCGWAGSRHSRVDQAHAGCRCAPHLVYRVADAADSLCVTGWLDQPGVLGCTGVHVACSIVGSSAMHWMRGGVAACGLPARFCMP